MSTNWLCFSISSRVCADPRVPVLGAHHDRRRLVALELHVLEEDVFPVILFADLLEHHVQGEVVERCPGRLLEPERDLRTSLFLASTTPASNQPDVRPVTCNVFRSTAGVQPPARG